MSPYLLPHPLVHIRLFKIRDLFFFFFFETGVRLGDVIWGRNNFLLSLFVFIIYGQTPRHYVVVDTPDRPRRAEEQYSYSYNQESSESRYDSSNPYSSVPSRSYSSSSERVARSTGSGPGNYSYSSERSSRSSDLPGGYHSSYSSVSTGRLPHGTSYRHYSYRV